jgi:hypothetical protein
MKPWYREIWPWLLMLPPLTAVAGGVTMAVLAIRTPDTLIVADYAHIEELTGERFALDREAARLGVTASLLFSENRIELTLGGAGAVPGELVLRLQHATDANLDRELSLLRRGAVFTVESAIPQGRYRIELLPPDRPWRLASGLLYPAGQLELSPQDAGG